MTLALVTGLPLSDLTTWHPRDIATGLDWLEARADAIKDATKQAGGR